MNKRIIYLFFAILLISAIYACKEKPKTAIADASTTTIVTFVSGDVKIAGINPARDAQIGDRLIENEVLKTGKESAAVVQIGTDSIVRLQANTEFNLEKILTDEKTVGLKQGEILCKISKLSKADGFRVKSPTVTAAVRGTQFSVKYIGKTTTVGVKEGKVAIIPAGETDFSKAKVAEPGFTAFSTEKPGEPHIITLRKISDEESKVLLKITDTPIIPEVDKKSSDEIKKMMDSMDDKAGLEAKQKVIIQRQSASLVEIKDAFKRLDEITLYNNRVIQGIIISRGETFAVVTPKGKVTVPAKEVKNVKVIR